MALPVAARGAQPATCCNVDLAHRTGSSHCATYWQRALVRDCVARASSCLLAASQEAETDAAVSVNNYCCVTRLVRCAAQLAETYVTSYRGWLLPTCVSACSVAAVSPETERSCRKADGALASSLAPETLLPARQHRYDLRSCCHGLQSMASPRCRRDRKLQRC
jgi:hypothetical protein